MTSSYRVTVENTVTFSNIISIVMLRKEVVKCQSDHHMDRFVLGKSLVEVFLCLQHIIS